MLNVEKTSGMAMAKTTAGQKVCSGVCWKAVNDGASSLAKSGWNCSASGKPTAASIAMRACLTSTSRYNLILPSVASEQKPSGSKKPSGPATPGRLSANLTGLNGGGASGAASCMVRLARVDLTAMVDGAEKAVEEAAANIMMVVEGCRCVGGNGICIVRLA